MNSPEEKAKELLKKFRPHASDIDPVGLPNNYAHKKNAKACAIICVNEILGTFNHEGVLVDGEYPFMAYPDSDNIEYYKKVKSALEAM